MTILKDPRGVSEGEPNGESSKDRKMKVRGRNTSEKGAKTETSSKGTR